MAKGTNVLEHLSKFEEICESIAAIGDRMDEDENHRKHVFQRELESMAGKESSEGTLQATKDSRIPSGTEIRTNSTRKNCRSLKENVLGVLGWDTRYRNVGIIGNDVDKAQTVDAHSWHQESKQAIGFWTVVLAIT
uniref:AlNc14C314G10523 protein n=1 Tax=Albugo laibachii Nc14 TaxID=890382 RepID=F0W8J6_9STRA|nr:AlNc14C35G3122 [Albugo laibachii Nc14]CCA25701.1 AlNc14C314G10523 [Albugo laibachii Nc14]|eukprot:CCA25701.1 AlNc14C314G10523 [Albugo laibachii Nc14]